jgi:transaldolase
MKLFLDTADVDEVREADSWGVLDGVTTNPRTIAETTRPLNEVIRDIVEVGVGPVSVEVTASDLEGMMDQAHEYADLASNIVIRIPMVVDGLKAVRRLSDEGIKTDVTFCFSPVQALLAAKAGATYVSAVIGRSDNSDHEGIESIREIRAMINNYQFGTQILVAGAQNPSHVRDAGVIGADAVTVTYELFAQLIRHPLSDSGIENLLGNPGQSPQ